ncbi:unnamed protein product [Chondrus crispus]|uniref:Uncharacterized protein n=1 Tax=Chondrus crispus TaxID=2769 RepID=R7QPF7_CHOCR|nr:unnamed protein product [Chondrus crispus]CDF39969.1 unnamed protein product [Chondrus crispus]|eukprot:XP_005710263.1 unnamed protein product [Chondrus crispus]
MNEEKNQNDCAHNQKASIVPGSSNSLRKNALFIYNARFESVRLSWPSLCQVLRPGSGPRLCPPPILN